MRSGWLLFSRLSRPLPVLYGILKTYMTAVPVNNRFKSYELGKVLAQCGLSVFYVSTKIRRWTDLVKLLKEVLLNYPVENSYQYRPIER